MFTHIYADSKLLFLCKVNIFMLVCVCIRVYMPLLPSKMAEIEETISDNLFENF